MTANVKLPRKLPEEQRPPSPRRPSHADVIENLDRWANSQGFSRQNHPKTRRPYRVEAGRKRRHRGEAPRRTRHPNAG
jgi:hypothetical protein